MVEFKVFFALGALGSLISMIFSDSDTGKAFYKMFMALLVISGFLVTWSM